MPEAGSQGEHLVQDTACFPGFYNLSTLMGP